MTPLLRNLLILLSYSLLAACPMAQPGSGPADGSRAQTGSGIINPVGPAGATGPADGSEGGGLPTGDTASTDEGGAGTVSDTPIVVSGTPLGEMPRPWCSKDGTRLFFGTDEIRLAKTGQKDASGREIILVRGMIYTQQGSNPPEGVGMQHVYFLDPAGAAQALGYTAIQSGCFMGRIHAPEGSVGRVIRLKVSILVCPPGIESLAEWYEVVAMKKKGEEDTTKKAAIGEPYYLDAMYDLTIPSATEETTLESCSKPTLPLNLLKPGMNLLR